MCKSKCRLPRSVSGGGGGIGGDRATFIGNTKVTIIDLGLFNNKVFEGKRHGVHPQNGIPGFSLYFPKELSYLSFEGNGKISPLPSNLRYRLAKII